MIRYYQRTIKDTVLRKLKRFRVGSWILVENPSEKDIETLVGTYKLDLGLLEDALDEYEVPRFEVEDGVVYIFIRVPYKDGDQVMTALLLLVIGPSFFLTLSPHPLSFLKMFFDGTVTDFFTTQKVKLLLQVLTHVVSEYNWFVNKHARQIRRYRTDLERITNKDIIQFVVIEEAYNDFLSALVPTSVVVKNLLASKHVKLFEDDKDLVEDLSLSIVQLIEVCKSRVKLISNIREAYSTVLTNNLNRVIWLLTVLAIIMTVPTIVSGFFGMNVAIPLATNANAFWIIMLITAGISGVLYWFFSRRKFW